MDTEVGGVRDFTVTVQSERGSYPVRIRAGILDELPTLLAERADAHRYALISDSRVWELHGAALVRSLEGAGLDVSPFVFPEGEASKNIAEWERLTGSMIDAGLGRDSAVIGLGGGVTTDLAGFVAATYMRGVPLVQVPTSVLAMADAAVGGKTGVNLPSGKNLVGAFHAPNLVVSDPTLVRTQSPDARADGWVEAVKHGAITDVTHLGDIQRHASQLRAGDADVTTAILSRTVAIKARLASEDERETGLRELLNFGHTLGHAMEAQSSWSLSHGQAVALGMQAEARAGELLGLTQPGTSEHLAGVLTALGLPSSWRGLDPAAVLASTVRDKKVRRGEVRYVILAEPGRAHEDGLAPLPDAVVLTALSEIT